ncbi:MAG TPA: L,D-transpeptidase [Candidatus Nanoarchaeia archaeon]|nr:L,D-transpeptidase [Candidatus Nanoarchaeia archaeon]
MAVLQRREFLKQASGLCLGALVDPFLPGEISVSDNLEQRIIINLPAYELTLLSLDEKYVFTISIGRNAYGRDPTPFGEGVVSEKRERVIFRYGQDYPQYNKKRGDVIYWTNTYDESGEPTGYKMPYKDMRSLAIKVKSTANGYAYWNDRNVIHSTTDEFTIGTPSSDGCVRVGIKDMLKLYDLVAPDVKNGKLKNPVKLEITYNVLELKNDNLVIHADVYKRGIDYAEEFKASVLNAGMDLAGFDYERVKKEFADANTDFEAAHKEILTKLMKGWPNSYLSPELKQRMHRTYTLSSFC